MPAGWPRRRASFITPPPSFFYVSLVLPTLFFFFAHLFVLFPFQCEEGILIFAAPWCEGTQGRVGSQENHDTWRAAEQNPRPGGGVRLGGVVVDRLGAGPRGSWIWLVEFGSSYGKKGKITRKYGVSRKGSKAA